MSPSEHSYQTMPSSRLQEVKKTENYNNDPHKDGHGHLQLHSCYHTAVKLSHSHYYRFCYRDRDNRARY